MRSRACISRLATLGTFSVLAAFVLAGCTSTTTGSIAPSGLLDQLLAKTPVEDPPPPPPPEKHGCGTPAQCKTALKRMVDDRKRGWVGEPQPAAEYTDGTRLFAYRAVRKKLSCHELELAATELRAASKSLAGSVPGVSPEQLSRTRLLNTQVEAELAKERGARCRA
jgi:hypothetical protein